MIFSWSQFVEIAEHLKIEGENNQTLQEAAYRSSVSRAYYGAYRHALNYAKSSMEYVPNDDGTDHKKLRELFKENGLSNISRDLSRLHLWRKDCDYDEPLMRISDLPNCVNVSISSAKRIIQDLA
ncbi:MAG: hypothetical protein ACP5C4_04525 [Methanomicrobiales archaeon]